MFARLFGLVAIFALFALGGCGAHIGGMGESLSASTHSNPDAHLDLTSWASVTGIAHCGAPIYLVFEDEVNAHNERIDGEVVITISDKLVARGEAATRFLLAHECGHYVAQHHKLLNDAVNQKGEFPNEMGYQFEIDADLYAVKFLLAHQDFSAIQAGLKLLKDWNLAGAEDYPSSKARIQQITNFL